MLHGPNKISFGELSLRNGPRVYFKVTSNDLAARNALKPIVEGALRNNLGRLSFLTGLKSQGIYFNLDLEHFKKNAIGISFKLSDEMFREHVARDIVLPVIKYLKANYPGFRLIIQTEYPLILKTMLDEGFQVNHAEFADASGGKQLLDPRLRGLLEKDTDGQSKSRSANRLLRNWVLSLHQVNRFIAGVKTASCELIIPG